MTPEEFERIKEAEKEHLRALKHLKRRAHMAARTRASSRAVSDMVSSLESLLDEHREMTDRLTHDAALQEARLEVGLESTRDRFSEMDPQQRAPESNDGASRPAGARAQASNRPAAEAPLPDKTIGRMRGAS